MVTYDIIGDIHGHGKELEKLLTALKYHKNGDGAYVIDEPNRQAIFVGDFIDRGPEQFGVLEIVRAMEKAGSAQAVMGNHEFNAAMYHTEHEGQPLRPHDDKNKRQHKAFLDAMEKNEEAAAGHIEWYKNLPLFLRLEGLDVIHALWDEKAIALLKAGGDDSVLDGENRIRKDKWAALKDYKKGVGRAAEILLKGIEIKLPDGVTFFDQQNIERDHARLKWWVNPDDPTLTLDQVVLDVPAGKIPALPLDDETREHIRSAQPNKDRVIFFGHYWQKGDVPDHASAQAICLDQSVARDGHLAAATVTVEDGKIQDIEFNSVAHRSQGREGVTTTKAARR